MLQCRSVNNRLREFAEHYIKRYGAHLNLTYLYKTWSKLKKDQGITAPNYIGYVLTKWGVFVNSCYYDDGDESFITFDPYDDTLIRRAKGCLTTLKGIQYKMHFPRNMFMPNLRNIVSLELSTALTYRDSQFEPYLEECKDTLQSLTLKNVRFNGECLEPLKNLTTLRLSNVARLNLEKLITCLERNPNIERFDHCLRNGFLDIPVERLCQKLKNIQSLSIGPIEPTKANVLGLSSLLLTLTTLTVKFTDTDKVWDMDEINLFLRTMALRNRIDSLGLDLPRKYRLTVDTLRSFSKFTSLKVLSIDTIWNFEDILRIIEIKQRTLQMISLNFEELVEAQHLRDIRKRRPRNCLLVKIMDTILLNTQIELNYFPVHRLNTLETIIEDCFLKNAWEKDYVTIKV